MAILWGKLLSKEPSRTSFSPHCFQLNYGSNLTSSILMMRNVEFLALMPQNAKNIFSPLLPLYLAAMFYPHFRAQCMPKAIFAAMLYRISGYGCPQN